MARTAITVSTAPAWLAGVNPTAVTGDAANDHSIDASYSGAGKLLLLAVNTNAATVAFTVEVPASAATYNETVSIAHTIPAAVGAVPGVRVIPFDSPAAAQTGNVFHIDSADANFGDVRFYAVTWADTQR